MTEQGDRSELGVGNSPREEYLSERYLKERNEAISMLGAVIFAQGGEIRINDESLTMNYSIESYHDETTRQIVMRATKS